MRVPEVLLVYLCLGVAVAALVSGPRRWFALALWPLVLPSLLAGARERFDTVAHGGGPSIAAALDRLAEALDQWQPGAHLPLDAAARALADLEARRAELAQLLARPEYRVAPGGPPSANVMALRALHERLEGEVQAAVARIDELTTGLRLAHFGGRPMGDVAAQLAELVAAVEGVQAAHAEVDGPRT